jgi:hypothetical protein
VEFWQSISRILSAGAAFACALFAPTDDNFSGLLIAREFVRHSRRRATLATLAGDDAARTARHGLALSKDFAVSLPLSCPYGGIEPSSLGSGSSCPFGLFTGLRPKSVTDRTSTLSRGRRYLLPLPNNESHLLLRASGGAAGECPDFPPGRRACESNDIASPNAAGYHLDYQFSICNYNARERHLSILGNCGIL